MYRWTFRRPVVSTTRRMGETFATLSCGHVADEDDAPGVELKPGVNVECWQCEAICMPTVHRRTTTGRYQEDLLNR